MSKIKIISTKKIEVIRSLAYQDKTPDMVKAGTIVGSGNFIRVMTLAPISYKFHVGTNVLDELITFTDPATKEKITESILTWPAVKDLIKRGIFEVYKDSARITDLDAAVTEEAAVEAKDEKPKREKKHSKSTSLDDIAETVIE